MALGPQLVRWGPRGGGPYHLWIPPQPHIGAWLERCRRQVAVEAPGTWFTMGCVVPRDACGGAVDAALVQRLVPAASALFEDPLLEVPAILVGERPRVLRVSVAERNFPPTWEEARLPRNKVLLLLHFRAYGGDASACGGPVAKGQST